MKNSLKMKCHLRKRGSALLIVLGFLSFMMISAVAFAIYMRIERQATSNFRYAATARQLINAALLRAMDEIDGDMRSGINRKFPEWPGRVRPSTGAGGSSARVLSLDALTYIPGILLNDVRYYAIHGGGIADADDPAVSSGASWLPLSMPMRNMEGADANGGAVVGRYAYVCVNVSDMLDVNKCQADRRDSGVNRVSISHLFESDAQRKAFAKRIKDTDLHYETLSDFYACMFQMDAPALFSSPWHNYLDANDDLKFFRKAFKHILVTDSKVKSELFNPDPNKNPLPFNVLLNETKPPVPDMSTAAPKCDSDFLKALEKALENSSDDLMDAGGYVPYVLGSLLTDYLDEDNTPKSLLLPSVEMAPLITQISPPTGLPVRIVVQPGKNAAGDPVDMYRLDLTSVQKLPLLIETAWPFKYSALRENQEEYELKVKAYLRLHLVHAEMDSSGFTDPPVAPNGYLIEYKGSQKSANAWQDIETADDACYVENVILEGSPLADFPFFDLFDSEGTGYNGFTPGSQISLSLVFSYVQVYAGGKCVDSAPCMVPFINSVNAADAVSWVLPDKLFFQTKPTAKLNNSVNLANLKFDFDWSCLETPDPRFNWKTANWFKSDVPQADGKLNTSAREMLGKEGRDADIFMAVSNLGALQSPGELGYLIRPFDYELFGKAKINFRSYNYAQFSNPGAPGVNDFGAMFKTFRLYDHGAGGKRDEIYKYFCASRKDGTVTGCRVNPLSDIPLVRGGAIAKVPLDYYVAGKITEQSAADPAGDEPQLFPDENFSFTLQAKGNSWNNFTNGWNQSFSPTIRDEINRDLEIHLSDKYGEDAFFKWYSSETDLRNEIFGVTLTTPLHEVDRKMLYSYTLDSFSDRQQLFLFFIRAEVTASAFGKDVGSLAGGKAVALVWRDPYPAVDKKGELIKPKDMYTGLISGGGVGYHEHNILYFRFLDN